jgi:hypothetical protein
VQKDCKTYSTRNTVETIASAAGAWAGGYACALGGALMGAAIVIPAPAVGMIIGSMAFGASGSIHGSNAACLLVDYIGDQLNYDIIEKRCRNCQRPFKIRTYRGENLEQYYCPDRICDYNFYFK